MKRWGTPTPVPFGAAVEFFDACGTVGFVVCNLNVVVHRSPYEAQPFHFLVKRWGIPFPQCTCVRFAKPFGAKLDRGPGAKEKMHVRWFHPRDARMAQRFTKK